MDLSSIYIYLQSLILFSNRMVKDFEFLSLIKIKKKYFEGILSRSSFTLSTMVSKKTYVLFVNKHVLITIGFISSTLLHPYHQQIYQRELYW